VESLRWLQRPLGGTSCIGRPGIMKVDGRARCLAAGQWDAPRTPDPANHALFDGSLVQGPLEMCWFRDVDFEITDRHAQGRPRLPRKESWSSKV